MNEEAGTMAAADAKEAASKRTSGIGLWPFTQRQSMDTDHDPRSSDRPRKAGMGGKVKPGQGGKHKHTGSGDLHAGEPPSPLSASATDNHSAAWTPGGFSQPEVTDTYSLSQLSPAPIATGTPSVRSKGNSFFKNLSFGSKRRNSRGAASPGVPSSPTLPGATPTHESSMSFSASASSTSGAAGSQSPADSLCHAAAGAARHAGSKLHSSSGDPDDAEYGSCCSDTMQSPSYAHNEGMYDDTLVLQQHGGYGMSADMSPMANMRHDLPDVFTPGFNQLLGQQCREPDTPQDATAMLEPTLALVGTAQLSQVAQLYAPEAMLLCSSHPAADDAVDRMQDSSAAAAAAEGDAVSTSGGQTLLEMEDVEAPDVPVPEACPAASTAATAEDQQPASAFVSAEDIEVTVCEGETSAAAPAADAQQELGPDAPAVSTVADEPAVGFTSTSRTASPDSNYAAASPTERIAAPSSPAQPAAAQAAADVHSSCEAPAAAAELSAEPAAVKQESPAVAEQPVAAVTAAAADLAQEPVCTAASTAEVLPAAETSTDGELQQAIAHTSSSPQSSPELPVPEQPAAAVDVSDHVSACTSPHLDAQQPTAADAAPGVPHEVSAAAAAAGDEPDDAPTVAGVHVTSRIASPQPADTVQEAGAADTALTSETAAEALEVPADSAQAQAVPEQQQQPGLEPQAEGLAQAPLAAEAAVSSNHSIQDEVGCDAGVGPQASACEDSKLPFAAVSSSASEPAAEQHSGFAQQQEEQQAATLAEGQPQEAAASTVGDVPSTAADGIDTHPEAAAAAPEQDPVATAEPVTQQDCPVVQIQAEAPAAEPVLAAEPSSEHMLAAEPAASEHVLVAEPTAVEPALAAEPAADALLGPSGEQQSELCGPSAAEQQQMGTVEPEVAEEDSQLLCRELAGDDTLSPVAEASEEPLVPQGVDSEPCSPTACFSSQPAAELSSPILTGPRSARRTGRTPVSMVRESIPLFMSDPSRALGSNLLVEDSLDDQDMQLLTSGTAAGAAAAAGAAGAAAAAASRLLAHGGPQRVALGFSGGLNPLTPVAEGFGTSPIPEETSTGGSSQSRSSSRYEAAAAGSPGTSPVRPLSMAAHGASPCFGMTPGSTYSTPTLTLGQAGGMAARSQMGGTPASAMSSAVGSAIRDIGSAGRMGALDRGLSPAMPSGLPNVSPTLNLLPNLGDGSGLGQGGSGDGSTPSLLDGRAASPSAVYSTLYTTTPFRGALAALPISEAVNAPLVDSSPFDLTDDGMFEKCGLAQEAQKVAQNLAAAAAAGTFGGATPFPAVTPGSSLQRSMSPGGTDPRAQLAERMASPELTDGLRDMHQQMVIKQITALERRVKELEGENERLKEQVDIYEFEKTELNSQEEMEKQARQYAEEQLQATQMQMQGMRQAQNEQHAAMQALKQEFEGLRQEAARKHLQDKEEALALEQRLTQMQDERNQALDRVNLLDMELTAVRSAVNDVQGALHKEQQRSMELAEAVAAKEKDMADMTRLNTELRSKLEKTMEQLIAAQTAKEHARQQAQEESAKAKQVISQYEHVMNEHNAMQVAHEKREVQWRELKNKYLQKSSTLKDVEAKLQAKEAEVAELMAMCDQLLQQHGS